MIGLLSFGLSIPALLLVLHPSKAEARPQYFRGFEKAFPDLKPFARETGCKVCHVGRNKKNRNPYGEAVGKALGGKNVKDARRIREALRKVGRPRLEERDVYARVVLEIEPAEEVADNGAPDEVPEVAGVVANGTLPRRIADRSLAGTPREANRSRQFWMVWLLIADLFPDSPMSGGFRGASSAGGWNRDLSADSRGRLRVLVGSSFLLGRATLCLRRPLALTGR